MDKSRNLRASPDDHKKHTGHTKFKVRGSKMTNGILGFGLAVIIILIIIAICIAIGVTYYGLLIAGVYLVARWVLGMFGVII